MASVRASNRNQNHARHGRLIPLQICWQVTSDSEAGVPRSGSLLIHAIRVYVLRAGGIKSFALFQSSPVEAETDRDGVCFF
jgi:hypothetical protein